jgi:CP family cyanate transporter-like MFS transporter
MHPGSDPGSRPDEHGPNRWILLFGVWLLYASFGLVATSLAPLVPIIEADLGLSHAAMGSILGAWQLAYIFAAIPCGILLDRIGPRRALVLGALMIAASAFGRSAATGYPSLLLAVMLFGIGGPIISAGAPKVVTDLFSGPNRGFAMGIYMTGPAMGGIVSLTLTHSVLLPGFDGSWRGVLSLWGFVTLAAGAIWWIIAPRPSTEDVLGRAAATPGEQPGSQGRGIRDLLRSPAVRLVMLMSVGLFTFNHGLNNWLPELLRSGGMSLIEAGYWAAIPTVVGIVGSLLIPRLATPPRRFTILFVLCLAALAASILLQSRNPSTLLVGLFMQGIARSALMTVLILTLMELPDIGAGRAGTASGLFFSAAEVGGVLGPLSLGLLYDATGEFGAGLIALSMISVALALATLRLRSLAHRPA